VENDVWLVKAVDRSTSADAAEAVAARMTTLLNDASLSISGASLLYLRASRMSTTRRSTKALPTATAAACTA
jgi:hypothetical protein